MLEEEGDGGEGLPAGEDFKFGEGEGDFGFVVGVGEVSGVAVVEFGCEGFGGVDLEGEGFGYGEDLGGVGQNGIGSERAKGMATLGR